MNTPTSGSYKAGIDIYIYMYIYIYTYSGYGDKPEVAKYSSQHNLSLEPEMRETPNCLNLHPKLPNVSLMACCGCIGFRA